MAYRPNDLLVYYGYPNSFNSAINGWNNENVAIDMAKYDTIVLGNGVANPSHPDYSNTQIILARLKAVKPDIKIFGYVSANQTLANFQDDVDDWDTLEVDGIFVDEAGYDFGVSRSDLNSRVQHIRSKTYAVITFANCWNMDHIIGTADDPSYPNSTFNPSLTASLLDDRDYYMLESFTVNTTAYSGNNGYATASDFYARGNKAVAHNETFGIQLATLNVVDNNDANGQDLADFSYNGSVAYGVELYGTSDTNYGASSAAVNFWARPTLRHVGRASSIVVANSLVDTDVYFRFGSRGRVSLDFSTGAQTSGIEIY